MTTPDPMGNIITLLIADHVISLIFIYLMVMGLLKNKPLLATLGEVLLGPRQVDPTDPPSTPAAGMERSDA